MSSSERHPVLYVLHSSQLYGTERMALATAQGLAGEFETIFIGPPGPGLIEAERLGFQTRQYRTNRDLGRVLWPLLEKYPEMTFVGTGPRYNVICIILNLIHRRRIKQVQIVHGGAGIEKDYGRKKHLNFFDVRFIAVSEWSRLKLIEHGVRNPILVIGNFIAPERLALLPRRAEYDRPGIRRVVLVSRIDAVKRVELLLDAMDRRKAELADISFRLLGDGPDLETLRRRAKQSHANVEFVGFSDRVGGELAGADLLVHTCPIEPFGVAVLEAMTAGVAALVPDAGGVTTMVEDGTSGFTFRADDADHLGARLVELKSAPMEVFNRITAHAACVARSRFSAEAALEQYRRVFSPE